MAVESARWSRTASFTICAVAYAVALAAAVAAGYMFREQHILLIVLTADVAATVVVFAFSVLFNNSSLYDPYWSVAPIAIAGFYLLYPNALSPDSTRHVVVAALVTIWGLRLTFNWARGWRGLHQEDWRYADYRTRAGRAYWLVSFFGFHLFPTLIVYLGCLGLYAAMWRSEKPLNWLDGIAFVVTGVSIWLEATADKQLRRFRLSKPEPDAILDTGLWAWSRHPNYLGEIGFWWGLYLFGVAAAPSVWWTVTGPVAITLLFVFVSLPLIETRHRERRPRYAEYCTRTAVLIPLPRRK